jgi:eukaryotic-like serine/threonine-protein kinase
MSQASARVADDATPESDSPKNKCCASDSTRVHKSADGHYRLEKQIGGGPVASVWLARDTRNRTQVVLKRLEPGSVHDPVARHRLEAEARTTVQISHPAVVPVIDQVFREDSAALVFPHVPGETLSERLRSRGRLEPRTAAETALDIADVLAAAHAAGVVHRDVKPGNILLGEDGRTRLLDFGIARELDNGDEDAADLRLELTGSGMAIGTLPYMAPEQLTGGAASAAADVYALGAVLYEMLSGNRPYGGRSPQEQLALQQRPPQTIPDVPEGLAALSMRALDVRPERRPSAGQFGRALRGWLDGREDADAATAVVAAAASPPIAAAAVGAAPMAARAPDASAPVAPSSVHLPAGPSALAGSWRTLGTRGRPMIAIAAGLLLIAAISIAVAATPNLFDARAGVSPAPVATPVANPAVDEVPTDANPPPTADGNENRNNDGRGNGNGRPGNGNGNGGRGGGGGDRDDDD